MNRSQSSGSESNANNGRASLVIGEVKCHCGKLSVVKKSWTEENPGRRFYGCGGPQWRSCNFFRWFDVEKPHSWQKIALLEAREVIREQCEELKKLRALVRETESHGVEVESGVRGNVVWSEMETENKKIKQEMMASNEKEKLLRQFVIISWLGFVGATAVIVHALK